MFIVLAGSVCAPAGKDWLPVVRKTAPIKDNILQADVICTSPTMAGYVALGRTNNGWITWKDESGNVIDTYRKNRQE